MSFAYQTLFFRPLGSRLLYFNQLRLTPCKWSRCQTPINQHFREPTSAEDIVMKANPHLPHPVFSNCETVAYPSVEFFAKEREDIQLLCWRDVQVLFSFWGKFYHLVSTFTGEWPSAVSHKNQLPHGSPVVLLSFLSVSAFTCNYFGNGLTIRLLAKLPAEATVAACSSQQVLWQVSLCYFYLSGDLKF